ncbi:MAG TPA: hypothetical protein VHJ18_00300 [Streptosporangiaceae bacterium]|jgi:hypothetical protein|nr:hypothetical protein [Streptosporangiaceae bacterium]
MTAITWTRSPERSVYVAEAGSAVLTVCKRVDRTWAAQAKWPDASATPAAVAICLAGSGSAACAASASSSRCPASPCHLNTAITLSVGVESYAAFALGAWLTPAVAEGARRFAKWSALGAIALGMTGQVAYHLLTSAHAVKAPTIVVVLVSCMPPVTFGMAVWLAHMLRSGAPAPETASEAGIPVPEPPAALNGHAEKVRELFAADLASGAVPGIGVPPATWANSPLRRPSPDLRHRPVEIGHLPDAAAGALRRSSIVPGQVRAESQEVAMHSQIVAMVAAEHVKDMIADAARAQRAREARRARRARRGAIAISSAANVGQLTKDPCPQLPCPPLSARAA